MLTTSMYIINIYYIPPSSSAQVRDLSETIGSNKLLIILPSGRDILLLAKSYQVWCWNKQHTEDTNIY